MTVLVIILVISLILNVVTMLLIGIQSNKARAYEDWIIGFQSDVTQALDKMREIDKRGTFATSMNEDGVFESDDEVGTIFKEMENIIEDLTHKIQ
jgi:hypothetical protein